MRLTQAEFDELLKRKSVPGHNGKPEKQKRAARPEYLVPEIIDAAHACGWIVAHFRPGLSQSGKWQTAVAGDGKGFLDLVLLKLGKNPRVIYAECKGPTTPISPEQQIWIDGLRAAGQEVYVWRPKDWAQIEAILTGKVEILEPKKGETLCRAT